MNKKVLIIKNGKLRFCLLLIFICFFAFTFCADLTGEMVYRLCANHVNTESKNLVLLDYKVFDTENKFNEKALDYAESKVKFLKSKGEFAVVKVKGEYDIKDKGYYLLITEDDVPNLNVRIYIAKNIDIGNNSLPAVTVSTLLHEILEVVVLVIYSIVFLILLLKTARYFCVATANPRERFFIKAEKKIRKTDNL